MALLGYRRHVASGVFIKVKVLYTNTYNECPGGNRCLCEDFWPKGMPWMAMAPLPNAAFPPNYPDFEAKATLDLPQ